MNILILQKNQFVEIPEAHHGKLAQYSPKSFDTCLVRNIRENPWFKLEGSVPVDAVIWTKGHARER